MIAEGGIQEPPSRRLPLLVLERNKDLIMIMMIMMMTMMLTMTRNTSRKTRMKESTQTASRLRCGLSR